MQVVFNHSDITNLANKKFAVITNEVSALLKWVVSRSALVEPHIDVIDNLRAEIYELEARAIHAESLLAEIRVVLETGGEVPHPVGCGSLE